MNVVIIESGALPTLTCNWWLKRFGHITLLLVFLLLAACTTPHNVDITLKETAPEVKTTTFNKAMLDLGLMSQIYGTGKVNIMARDIIDNTGSSIASSAEIPRDITEMLKSTLNGFGGNIVYIPYDPDFIINSANTGYSGFNTKVLPDVVVSGGITEFDRGLETRGKNTDLSLGEEIKGRDVGFDLSKKAKNSTASITLDFNLIDFKTLTGISRMQAINNIKVYKALAEDSLAFSISGNSLGFKGTVKKVQGRHAAVRLVVQLSMIQVTGKYLKLPYWKLLPDLPPDPVVIDQIVADFYQFNEKQRIAKIQEYLVLNGYELSLSGQLDESTKKALKDFAVEQPSATGRVDKDTYLALYTSVPVTHEALYKRKLLASANEMLEEQSAKLSKDGHLRLSINESTFAIGDAVEINFAVTQPLYVKIYNVSSTGEVSVLFPAENARGLLLPGKSYEIPSKNDEYKLTVTGPPGKERIIAVASPTPFPRDMEVLTNTGKYSERVLKTLPTRVSMGVLITEAAPEQLQIFP